MYARYNIINGLRNKLFGITQRELFTWVIGTFLMHNYVLFIKGLKIVSIMIVRLILIYCYTFFCSEIALSDRIAKSLIHSSNGRRQQHRAQLHTFIKGNRLNYL